MFHYYLPYPVSISTGDPVFIAWDGNSGTVAGRDGSSRIPSEFALWVEGNNTITVDGATVTSTIVSTGNYVFTISPKDSGDTTIVAVSGGETYTITCGPKSATRPATSPSSIVSYLPIGQFAQGSGWGTTEGKFVGKNALDSTGVSLGAFGGYIEFKFDDGITNDENNPYGVDFVVYGNAFNGNPEAAAVQVSEDGKTWYELAGSKYYDGNFNFTGTKVTNKFSKAYTGTLNNATVNYTGTSSQISATVTASGTTMTANPLVTSYGWWPTEAKGYPMNGSYSNTGSNIQVNHSDSALMFSGLTMIPDSDTTADYAFGYADVTPNGSPATYGDAVNPYTPYTSGKTGGDGFDLEWAVDISTRLPVDVTGKTFHYVRVYTAVLDHGTFGETSAEVCGIFTTANKSSDSVNRTAAPTIKYGTSESAMTTNVPAGTSGSVLTRTVPAGTYYINATSAAENLYINGSQVTSGAAYSFTVKAGEATILRIIAQDGAKQPFIKLVKLTGR